MRNSISGIFVIISLVLSMGANATLVSISGCSGANSCEITDAPPNPVQPNPNNGVLLAWDEVQNFTLTSDLRVDRVFDATAPFITATGDGDFLIAAGTVVSSHYVQWDPGNGSGSTVQATIELDSQVFAFITADQNLFDSDASLGLPGFDYNDFDLRGLETGDTTVFNGPNTDINWFASSPGDWTRLITAFSPGGVPPEHVPLPGAFGLFIIGVLSLAKTARHKN